MLKITIVCIVYYFVVSLVSTGISLLISGIFYRRKWKALTPVERKNRYKGIQSKNLKWIMWIAEIGALAITIYPALSVFDKFFISILYLRGVILLRILLLLQRLHKSGGGYLSELIGDKPAQDTDHAVYK